MHKNAYTQNIRVKVSICASIGYHSDKEITICIRENCGYPQNTYPWIHMRAFLVECR